MKRKLYLSDIKRLLQLFAPAKYDLVIFDPDLRLECDESMPMRATEESLPLVLVSLAKEVICYKEYQLEDFDLLLDFGKSDVPTVFHNTRFAFLNNRGGTMRWLCSPLVLNTVLSFYTPSTARSKVFRIIIQLAHLFQISKLLYSGTLSIHHKNALPVESVLKPIKWDTYSIFMGTSGYFRTAVVAAQSNGRTTHFAKIAFNKQGVALVQNEQSQLGFVQRLGLQTTAIPSVLPSVDPAAVLVSNAQPDYTEHRNEMGKEHFALIQEMFQLTRKRMWLHETLFWDNTLNNLRLISGAEDVPRSAQILQLLNQLKAAVGANEFISCTLAHGDFTPWNIKVGKKDLYVYDWELSRKNVPALFDLFHFHFQSGIIAQKHGLKQILKRITKSCEAPKIKQLIRVHRIDVKLHLKLYLLRTVSTNLATFEFQEGLSMEQRNQLKVWEQALTAAVDWSSSKSSRQLFITGFSEKLSAHEHAFLKFDCGALERLPETSDLDLVVLKNDLLGLVEFCRQHHLVHRCRVARKSFMATIELFFEDGSFLSLDLIYRFKRKGLEMLEAESILSSAGSNEWGVRVPSLTFDLEYALLFYALNGAAIPQRYVKFFTGFSLRERNAAFRYIRDKYTLEMHEFNDLFTDDSAFRKKVGRAVRRNAIQPSIRPLINAIDYLFDTARGLVQRKGFIVTISGVDGVGKTTILEKVKREMELKFRREVVLKRHRPRLLPILSAMRYGGAKKAELVAAVTMPRQGQNHNILSSFLRFGYYYADYLFGQVYVYLRYVMWGKIVLYDRYYFDFITDSERSNIRLNKRFIQLLYVFVVKPRLNVLLWANSKVVYQRKQELEPETIEQVTGEYKRIFTLYDAKSSKSKYCTIENREIETTVSMIMEEFGKVA